MRQRGKKRLLQVQQQREGGSKVRRKNCSLFYSNLLGKIYVSRGISSLAKDPRVVDTGAPGLTRDSVITRPGLPASSASYTGKPKSKAFQCKFGKRKYTGGILNIRSEKSSRRNQKIQLTVTVDFDNL